MREAQAVVDVWHLERAIADRDPAWRDAPRFVPVLREGLELFDLAERVL